MFFFHPRLQVYGHSYDVNTIHGGNGYNALTINTNGLPGVAVYNGIDVNGAAAGLNGAVANPGVIAPAVNAPIAYTVATPQILSPPAPPVASMASMAISPPAPTPPMAQAGQLVPIAAAGPLIPMGPFMQAVPMGPGAPVLPPPTAFEQFQDNMAAMMQPSGPGLPVSIQNPIPLEEDRYYPHDGKVFVGGISQFTNVEQLKEFFSQMGEVKECFIKTDAETQRSRGFAFVTFVKPEVALFVIDHSPYEIGGKMLDCKVALPHHLTRIQSVNESQKKIFIGGLPGDCEEHHLAGYFGLFGPLEHVMIMMDPVTNCSRGFGYVTYKFKRHAAHVVAWGPHLILGRVVGVRKSLPKALLPKKDKNSMAIQGNGGDENHVQPAEGQAEAASNQQALVGSDLVAAPPSQAMASIHQPHLQSNYGQALIPTAGNFASGGNFPGMNTQNLSRVAMEYGLVPQHPHDVRRHFENMNQRFSARLFGQRPPFNQHQRPPFNQRHRHPRNHHQPIPRHPPPQQHPRQDPNGNSGDDNNNDDNDNDNNNDA